MANVLDVEDVLLTANEQSKEVFARIVSDWMKPLIIMQLMMSLQQAPPEVLQMIDQETRAKIDNLISNR